MKSHLLRLCIESLITHDDSVMMAVKCTYVFKSFLLANLTEHQKDSIYHTAS